MFHPRQTPARKLSRRLIQRTNRTAIDLLVKHHGLDLKKIKKFACYSTIFHLKDRHQQMLRRMNNPEIFLLREACTKKSTAQKKKRKTSVSNLGLQGFAERSAIRQRQAAQLKERQQRRVSKEARTVDVKECTADELRAMVLELRKKIETIEPSPKVVEEELLKEKSWPL